MTFRRTGDKRKFEFMDAHCIGRECWAPGEFQHRGATMSGSRNTGRVSHCCLTRAYRGCPIGPVGERKANCDYRGCVVGFPCPWCAGTGLITIAGLPEHSKNLEAKRKAEGWRRN